MYVSDHPWAHGGLGIHGAHPARLSHFTGRFAADWSTITTLFPALSSINLTTSNATQTRPTPYLPTIVGLWPSATLSRLCIAACHAC